MPEKVHYEFDTFRLDPLNGILLREGTPIQLRAKPFELLLVFVENCGRSLSKNELISRVWPGSTVSDTNFHVNLDAVRKALGESGREPRLIVRTGTGYKFVADVGQIEVSSSPESYSSEAIIEPRPDPKTFKTHRIHILVSSSLYGSYYGVSWVLEIAYQFGLFGVSALKTASFVFLAMAISAMAGLEINRRLNLGGSQWALAISVLWFVFAAGVLFIAASQLLPDMPITESTLQTYPAQAAYLKNICYSLVLAFFFLILPFNFIVGVEGYKTKEVDESSSVSAPQSGGLLGVLHPRFFALALLLVVLAGWSLIMTARLLDHLKPGSYMNLFIELVYLRALIYFGLGIECLIWYYHALEELRQKIVPSRS